MTCPSASTKALLSHHVLHALIACPSISATTTTMSLLQASPIATPFKECESWVHTSSVQISSNILFSPPPSIYHIHQIQITPASNNPPKTPKSSISTWWIILVSEPWTALQRTGERPSTGSQATFVAAVAGSVVGSDQTSVSSGTIHLGWRYG